MAKPLGRKPICTLLGLLSLSACVYVPPPENRLNAPEFQARRIAAIELCKRLGRYDPNGRDVTCLQHAMDEMANRGLRPRPVHGTPR
jgi:hypothetical protein